VEVRYRHKSGLGWIGDAVHLSEHCDEVWGQLMSPVNTTLANIADAKRPDAIQRALVATGPAPNTHPRHKRQGGLCRLSSTHSLYHAKAQPRSLQLQPHPQQDAIDRMRACLGSDAGRRR
jgi:hypothetical protein